MPLTDSKLRGAKPKSKPYKLTHGRGLYCLVGLNGSKLWRLNYRFEGKQKTLALGAYPEVSLKKAKEKAFDARTLLVDEIDPGLRRKAGKESQAGKESFETVAREWHKINSNKWAQNTTRSALRKMQNDLFPYLGKSPINEITAPQLLAVLRRVESRGAIETAHRVKALASQVFRFAIITGQAERDPSADLKGALTPVKTKHFAAITEPRKVAELLRALQSYQGTNLVRAALLLSPHVFVRPGELRHVTWGEISFEEMLWRIPAEKMKMNREHLVPLSRQSVEILQDLKPETNRGVESFVFPSLRSYERPMSDNTINGALRCLGYSKDEMTSHGFRAMASTCLHEQGWRTDIIERQLAHVEGNRVKAAYNHAQYLNDRIKMMQAWSDYLDGLKSDRGNKVAHLRKV